MDYGFSINITGKSIEQMKEIEKSLGRLGVTATNAGKTIESSFDRVAHKASEVGEFIAKAFAVEKIIEFGKKILDTTAEFEGFDNRIRFASLNAYDAQKNIAFLGNEIDRLHIPMRQAFEGFSEMQAGLVGTGIEGDRLRTLFEGISTAAATLHLPAYQLQRTLYDLKEIGEIGINMRIARSLSTALPGINKIVKDTFHKSLHELEKEGIGGGEFLAKLGPALTKHFEGGLANFSQSLQAKMTDVGNTVTKTYLEMGDKLRPFFVNILGDIGKVFDSAPVQFFIENIGGLANALVTAGATWVIYKGLVMGATVATKAFTVATAIMETVVNSAKYGNYDLAFSFEALGISITSLGFVVAAFSLAVIIEEFIDLNKQIEDALDNATNFKAVAATYKSNETAFKSIVNRAATTTDPEDKKALLTDVNAAIKSTSDAITKVLKPSLNQATGDLAKRRSQFKHPDTWYAKRQMEDEVNVISDFKTKITKTNEQLQALTKIQTDLIKKGVKPYTDGKLTPTGSETGSGHSSHLSGAEGGLDKARIVNLKIDTVMKVTTSDNKNLVKHATDAADMIIRIANNLSESRSGTF